MNIILKYKAIEFKIFDRMQRERLSKLKTIPPTEQQTEGDF
jgi:hypothetical protein